MVKINKDLKIESDDYNWIVKKRIKKKNKDEHYWKSMTYHRSLEDALESIYEHLSRAEIQKKDYTIKQAVAELKKIRNELKECKWN